MVAEEAGAQIDVEASGKKEAKSFKIKEKKEETNQKRNCLYTLKNQKRKKIKIVLGGTESEKVQVPSYGDNDQDETLLLLIKDFNLLVEDGDLLKEEAIGSEENDRPFNA